MGTGKIIQADKIQGLADVPNFLSNPNGLLNTSGWTEGSYTAGSKPTGNFTASSGAGKFSISRTTTNPLGMTGTSLVFTKASGNQQGRAVETIFPLPLDYRAKVLKLSASYINTSTNATDFAAGSDTTNSDMIFYTAYSTDGGTTYTVAEPSSFKLLSNSKDNSSPYDGTYQAPYNATHLKLIAYVATTSTTAWSIKAVLGVSPSQYVYGTPITDWQSYTLVIGSTGTAPAEGTGVTKKASWRRVGDSMELNFEYQHTGSGSAGSGIYLFPLPPGYTIDSSKITSAPTISSAIAGPATVYSSTLGAFLEGHAQVGNPTNIILTVGDALSPVTTIGGTFAPLSTPTLRIAFKASVPVLGWSSSVQMSDGYDGRNVSTKMYPSANLTGLNPNASAVKLNINAAIIDKVGGANTASNRIDVKTSGVYDIKAAIELAGTNILSGGTYRIYIYKNGSAWRFGYIAFPVANGNTTSLIGNFPNEELLAGDYLELYLYSGSNHSVNTLTAVGGTNMITFLSIEKLSGSPTISASETVACNVALSATTSVGASVTQITGFGTPTDNSHGAFANNEFTAPISGRYFIDADMMFYVSVVISTGTIDLLIKKDGSTVKYARSNLITSTIYINLRTSLEIRLKAGEKISFATQKNGDLTAVAHNDVSASQISIFKIGN